MGVFSFVPAPIPPDDHERSRLALASGLVTAVPDPRLTLLTREARRVFAARWSGLCIIADDAQHVVASSGGMLGSYRRATSLSSYSVAYPDEPFCLLDAAADERFAGNPFVDDGLIRFFVAAAVRQGDHVLGALCVSDQKPHDGVTPEQLRELQRLADAVG